MWALQRAMPFPWPAALPRQGMIPVVAVYSTFLQRAYDMILQDVAMLHLHVIFAVDRAGLVGEDGETHHGLFDVGFLRQVPGLTILCPGCRAGFGEMLSGRCRSATARLPFAIPEAVTAPSSQAAGRRCSGWAGISPWSPMAP